MQQKKTFENGINSDTVDENLPQGVDRYRLNVRAMSSDNSTIGAIETVNGNTLVSFTLPAGVTTNIGSREDVVRKKIYYFNYNTLGNHTILEFNAVTNTIAKVLQSSLLNFDIDHLITGINIVELDANNHLLYWTDFYNEPRKINIEKGKYFMAGDFINGYPTPFVEEYIYRIKEPMLLSPTAVYDNDSTVTINRLDKKLFQFKVSYVYDDKEESAWSPISKTVYPLSTVVVGENNVIKVTVDTGISIADRIRIAAKESTSSNFKLVADIDKRQQNISSNTTYVYYFYNDGNYPILEVNQSVKLFDNVPKLSQSQELIKGDRIVDGLIVEGYDPVEVDLKLDYTLASDEVGYSVDDAVVTVEGSGYTGIPSVAIGGVGTGATAVATIKVGPTNSIPIIYGGSGYTVGQAVVAFDGGGGTGLAASVTVNGGGVVTQILISNYGSGYTSAPAAIITDNLAVGVGASAVVSMCVDDVLITDGGSGYESTGTTATFGDGGGTGLAGTVTLAGNTVSSVTITNPGTGYSIAPPLTFTSGGGGVGTIALAYLEMEIEYITVLSPGTGYTSVPAIGNFTDASGTGGSATAALKGVSVSVVSGGAGYTTAPIVTFVGGGGGGMTGTAVLLNGAVDSINITSAGTGYTSPPTVTFSYGGAIATAIMGIEVVTVTAAGSGYIAAPSLTITGGGGSGAVIVAKLTAQAVNPVTVTEPGAGYSAVTTVNFADTLGQDAAATLSLTGADFDPINALKRGGTYTEGIIYYGNGNRSGLTNINEGKFSEVQSDGNFGTTLFIPFYTQINPLTLNVYGGSYPIITWNIYNEPPSWATHYQIARVKNSANDKYIQFVADEVFYLDRKGDIQTFGDPTITQFSLKTSNITGEFKTANPGSILVYDFVPGDRVRFIKDQNGDFLDDYYDFEVSGYDAGTGELYALFPPGVYPGTYPDLEAPVLFEIYQPTLQVPTNNKLTYEIGACYDISTDIHGNKIHEGDVTDQLLVSYLSSTNAYASTIIATVASGHGLIAGDVVKVIGNGFSIHGSISVSSATSVTIDTTGYLITGTYNTNAGIISKAAQGTLTGGDTFYRPRTMPYDAGVSTTTRLIEDANYSDLYLSPGYDYGRPNRIDAEYREVKRVSTVYYSEKFIPETNINGLSSVFDTSFETYEAKYGGIYKLYGEDQRLLIFQELKVGQVLIEQARINSTSGAPSIVGQATSVLSPVMDYYAGEYGIGKYPESFWVYAQAKYFIDVFRGVVCRLSTDGLTPISETAFMHNYFTDKCKAVLASTSKIKIYGVYDVKFKEYVIAFSAGTGVTAETLAFNEKENQWSSYYSFVPEGMCSNGIDIISFKNGGLWKHNINTTQNNFYGVQYNSEIWSILNQEPSNVKIFESISQEGLSIWEVPEISNTNGQVSNLITQDFQMKEGMQYAPLWRDTNTPNVVAPALPLFEGDVMRAQTFLVKMRHPLTTYNKLFAVNFKYIISNLHD